ncbi:MAG: hypothetical protein ABWZ76_11265 [Acidimicrobiales bacterium]
MVAFVAAMAAGGCGTDREVTQPEPDPVTEENVAAALLTVADLPDGFTAAAPASAVNAEVVPEHLCDDGLADLVPEESATTDFAGSGVTLTHSVAWFPGAGPAVEQLLNTVASACSQVVIADQGISLRTAPLDFGVLSDDTLAVRFELEPTSGPITERDVILRREGDLVSVVRLSGPRPSDKTLLDTVVRTTMGRLGALGLATE